MTKQEKEKRATRFNLIVAILMAIVGTILFFIEGQKNISIALLGLSGGLFGAEFWRNT